MRLLLDTHVWLWMLVSPDRIADPGLALLADPENELLLSAASSWEISIKYCLGKLPLPSPPDEFISTRLVRDGVTAVPVEHRHALHVARLPPLHRDPFDRLLVAQAQVDSLTIVTADDQILAYEVDALGVRS